MLGPVWPGVTGALPLWALVSFSLKGGPSRSPRTLESLSLSIPLSFPLGLCLSLRLCLPDLSECDVSLLLSMLPSVDAHLCHRLLSCLVSKNLNAFSHLQILSPLRWLPPSLSCMVLPLPPTPGSPAHSSPKPLSGYLENLGRKPLTQDRHPQDKGTQESGHDERNQGCQGRCHLFFCFLPPILVGIIHSFFSSQRTGPSRAKAHICL